MAIKLEKRSSETKSHRNMKGTLQTLALFCVMVVSGLLLIPEMRFFRGFSAYVVESHVRSKMGTSSLNNLQLPESLCDNKTIKSEVEDLDTAIIVSSSWIPTHPSTYMVDATIASAKKYLKGLNRDTPIIVTIDHLGPKTPQDTIEERKASLDQYVDTLFHRYLNESNVVIMPSMEHWHVGGTVRKALKLIREHFPSVEFLYYMQHDFEFVRSIDHNALTDAMKSHPDINYIRFKYKKMEHAIPCGPNVTIVDIESQSDGTENATIWHTAKYSDQNHLVRFDWYLDAVIEPLGFYKRFPENPLMHKAGHSCQQLGLYTYGSPGQYEPPVLRNLDGRLTTSLNVNE